MSFEGAFSMSTCRRNSTFKESADHDANGSGSKIPQIDKEKEIASTLALQQLIARVLVDPSTSVPLDSNSLHKKVLWHSANICELGENKWSMSNSTYNVKGICLIC